MSINNLDKTDTSILRLLQNNSQLTIKEIAQQVNMSITPVHERIKKMEQEGIIERYVAILNKEKLGVNLTVYCTLSMSNISPEEDEVFHEAVMGMPEVVEANYVAGSFDYLLKIVVENMDAYYQFHKHNLASLKNVTQINSIFVMNVAKSTTALPI